MKKPLTVASFPDLFLWLRAEVLRDGFDEAYIGIADTHRVIKGLADNERLKSRFLMSPIGVDPLAQTIQTQSASDPSRDREVGPALSPVNPPQAKPAQPVGLTSDLRPLAIPRNAPCPCDSGLKYKRCCGAAAPPVLTASPGAARAV